MPRYVILHHTGIDSPHFDLMIELLPGAMLPTWRLPNWPPAPNDQFTRLGDHRREYLEYEGPVSGNRGRAERVGSGNFEIIFETADELVIQIDKGITVSLPMRGH